MRRAAGALLLCFGFAGCGADEVANDVKETVDPVAAAAEKTTEAGDARIEGRMWLPIQGVRIRMDITGAVSFTDDRLQLHMDYAENGIPGAGPRAMREARREAGFPHDQILDADQGYVQNPRVRERAGEDKWLWIDLARVDEEADLDLSALAGMSEVNPSAMLEFLRTTGTSRAAGRSTIDGQSLSRYRARVDYADYPATVPEADRAAAERTVALLKKSWGDTALDVTVWIDHAGLIRRERFSFDVPIAGDVYPGTAEMDFVDVGDGPAIDIPDPEDTIDITQDVIDEAK